MVMVNKCNVDNMLMLLLMLILSLNDDDNDGDFVNDDNVPALSSDVLMAPVVKLLPFTPDPLVPKLGV